MKIQQHAFLELATVKKVVAKEDIKTNKYPLKNIQELSASDIQRQRVEAVKAMPVDVPVTIIPHYSYTPSVESPFSKDRVAFHYQEEIVDKDNAQVFGVNPKKLEDYSLSISTGSLKSSQVESVVKEVKAFAEKNNHPVDDVKLVEAVTRRLQDNLRAVMSEEYNRRFSDDFPF